MRVLFEIFFLLAGIGVIFALSKGFPGFGHALRVLLLSPLGWLAIAGVAFWIYSMRKRRAAQRAEQ